MKASRRFATRSYLLTAVVFSFPVVTGADDRGCARGGDVPVGSNGDAGPCTHEICRDLPRQLDAKICADGTLLGRSVCTLSAAGLCGWEFPACPDVEAGSGHTDAAPPACQPSSCFGLPVRDDAKVCPDGSTLGRTVCALGASGACDWDFPACADKGDAAVCAESDCAGQPRDNDARICPDGTVVGRTTCTANDGGRCYWDFPPCAK